LHVTGTARATTGFSANDGTAGSPAFYFTNEASTGSWRPTHWDKFAFSSTGTEKMRLTSTGLGIGTTAPAATLSIGTGATNKLNISGTDGDVTFTAYSGIYHFPGCECSKCPMIQMFASGTTNTDRMIFSHSSAFPTYGLQYSDQQINLISFRTERT
jgi:hypothetical protein